MAAEKFRSTLINVAMLLLCFYIISTYSPATEAFFKFTNINCTGLDKEFGEFAYCYIKAVNRSYNYMSFRAKLYKSFSKGAVRVEIFKRVSGGKYQPYFLNYTVDTCKFMAAVTKERISKLLYSVISDYTNMNHTCPYNHDLIIEKLDSDLLNYKMTYVLPIPHGEYYLNTIWYAYGVARAQVRVYGKFE